MLAELTATRIQRPVRPARRPDRGRRRARGDRRGHLRDEPGPPEPGRPAGVHGLPQPHVLAAAGAHEPGELALLGRGRRGAGDRAARRAARGGRAPRGAAARAPARRGGGRGRLVHLPRRARPRPARREHARRAGRARGGGRRERLGQVDARPPAAAPGRPGRRRGAPGRPRPARPGARLRCAATSRSCCRRRWSSTGRSPRTSPTAGPRRRRRRSPPPPSPPTPTTSSCACPRATRPRWVRRGGRCRAASASGWRSRGPSCAPARCS